MLKVLLSSVGIMICKPESSELSDNITTVLIVNMCSNDK